jgi:hypothetical protein
LIHNQQITSVRGGSDIATEGVPRGLERVIASCLRKDRNRRLRT